MIIQELHLIHFGKFQNCHVELGPRLNLITGGNESGKTTIFAFIEGMLFGIRPARGRASQQASDLYARYRPWETPQEYEGAMIFEHEGQIWRLYRNFYRSQASVSLQTLDGRQDFPLVHGVITDFIPALTQENFRNTLGISQDGSSMDVKFALSLQGYAANLAMTGSQNLNLSEALADLNRQKKALKKDMQIQAPRMQELQGRIRELMEVLENHPEPVTPEDLDQEAALQDRLEDANQKLEENRQTMGILLGERKRLLVKLLGKRSATQQDVGSKTGTFQTEEKTKAFAGEEASRESYIFSEDRAQTFAREAAGQGRKSFAIGLICILAGIAAGLAGLFFRERLPIWILAVCLAGCVLLLCAGLIAFSRYHRNQELLLLQAEYEQQENRGFHLKRERQEISLQLEQMRQELARRRYELEVYNEKKNVLQELQEELADLEGKERQREGDVFCLQTAVQTLEEIAAEIYGEYGEKLWGRTGQLLEQLTGTARQVHIDPDLHICVDNGKEFVPLDRYSRGMNQQLYLLLRLASADLLFGQTPIPFLADDAFADYDDDRLSWMLKWLAEDYGGQVILLGCTHRECDLMDTLGCDYNYVRLSQHAASMPDGI